MSQITRIRTWAASRRRRRMAVMEVEMNALHAQVCFLQGLIASWYKAEGLEAPWGLGGQVTGQVQDGTGHLARRLEVVR